MLTKEKIIENFKRYEKALTDLGIDTDKLFSLYGGEIVGAPETTNLEYGNAYEGGLIQHLLDVAEISIKINKTFPAEKQVDQSSLLKVAFLHQISLANTFKKIDSKWHNDRGIMYEYVNHSVSLTTGERSAKHIMDAGIVLSDVEYQAILNFNKVDDIQSKMHTEILGEIIKSANVFSRKLKK